MFAGKNKSILKMAKIGHHAKAIAFAKKVSLGQKLKMSKRCENRYYDHIKVVVCKKVLQKTPNIGKMRGFWKWPKLATTRRL